MIMITIGPGEIEEVAYGSICSSMMFMRFYIARILLLLLKLLLLCFLLGKCARHVDCECTL